MERLPGPRRPTLPASLEAAGRLRDWPSTVREDAADTIDWRRTLATLWRGRFVILGLTLLGTLGGLWATRFFHPQYVARATIWIDESQHRGADIGPIRSERLFDPEAWLDLIKSDVVLTPVVRDAGLLTQAGSPADSAALAGATLADPYRPGTYLLRVDPTGRMWSIASDGAALDSGAVGDSVGKSIGLHWQPLAAALTPARTVTFTLLPAHDAARQLAEQLQLHIDLNGNLLTVELAGSNSRRVTATVNAIAKRYVEVATGLQQQKLTELASLLEDQRQQAEQQLQGAETALERFRVQTITLPSLTDAAAAKDGAAGGERDPAIASFFNQQFERQSLQQDRTELEQVLAQTRDSGGVSAERLLSIGAVQHSAELPAVVKELTDKEAQLRALQLRYGDTYPTIQRLSEDIQTLKTATIPAAVRTLLAQLATRETQLATSVGTGSQTLRQIPARALDQSRLERSVTLATSLYSELQQRADEARLAQASSVADTRVLDAAAQPHRPSRNAASRIVLLAILGGFGVGMLGVLLVDRIDPRVRHPRQVTEEIGLPILGVLPHCRPASMFQMIGRVPRDMAEMVEAVRAACFSLAEAYGPQRPVIVTVTSPGAGEGKSFVSANLAMAFAHGGLRVLLVDADLRRGVQHRCLGTDRRPGLAEYLRGDATLEAVTLSTVHPRLALIPCGARDRNPPALLAAPALPDMLSAASRNFDIVLVDSPPLGAGVDPLLLAKATGNLLLVLRTGRSHREVARTKLDALGRIPMRLLGAILNDARPSLEYTPYSYSMPGYEAVGEGALLP